MSLLSTLSQSSNPVTTDWDDIQRRIGNLPALEAPEPAPAWEPVPPWEPEEVSDALLHEKLRVAGEGGPGCSADTSADTDAVVAWRATRLRELRGEDGRFGAVVTITHEQFVPEVNRAGEGVGVVVFLFKKGHYPSQYMRVLMEKLAAKFRRVKFVQIGHEECIPGYPDANLPTLLMYKDDDLVCQTVGADAFGGPDYGIDDVEWEIAQAGLVRTDVPRNPHAERHR